MLFPFSLFMKPWKKKPELTGQQYRTIKGQILAGDEDGAIRGIDRVVERNRRGRGYHAT